jgi:hypothetical protein
MGPGPDGKAMSKASARAVMRNLQRLESRLLDQGVISRRVLGKTFERYDAEGAGRYYLERIDREQLDEHLEANGREAEITEPVVLIRIPRLHRPGMSEDELYEATRKWWAMSPHRHNPGWGFTVVDGRVRAVYWIDGWERHPENNRWAFRGARDPEMESRYAGMALTKYLPQGAQNPIRYVNC